MRCIPSVSVVLAVTVSLCGYGCEEKKTEPEKATATPVAPPAPEPEPEPEPVKPSRPEKIETDVTPERRAKVEAAMPETKGFLVASELEETLKGNKKNDKPEVAIPAFDRLAAGKWVLFTGPVANLTATGFDLGITYTPQLPNDPMGMSRQWFPVTFSEVKGYDQDKLQAGQVVVVLAKYGGKQKAGPGEELVEAGRW
jgi:hypothetical protein